MFHSARLQQQLCANHVNLLTKRFCGYMEC